MYDLPNQIITLQPGYAHSPNPNLLKLFMLSCVQVVDDCDKVVCDGHEMEELMSCWASQRDNISDYEKQLIMACSKVTQDLRKFVTNYMKGSVKLIACGIEAVVWNEVPVVSVLHLICDYHVNEWWYSWY